MVCFGLFSSASAAEGHATRIYGGCKLYTVPAMLNGDRCFAVVDGTDRHSLYTYDLARPRGHRLKKETADASQPL